MHGIDIQDARSRLTVGLGCRIDPTAMMLTFLLSIVICALAVLMLGHAYIRVCRNYIERYQQDAGILAACSADVGVAKASAGALHKDNIGVRSTTEHRRRSREPRTFSLAIPITALARAA